MVVQTENLLCNNLKSVGVKVYITKLHVFGYVMLAWEQACCERKVLGDWGEQSDKKYQQIFSYFHHA